MNDRETQQQSSARPGLFGLTSKQKRLLRFAFLAVVLAGGGAGTYAYIASAPERAEKEFQEAMKSMKPGYYQVAIQGFDRALKTWSGHAECYFERGNANHILGHDEEAMADYEKAVDLNPNLYRAYAAMGAIYREKKDYRRAMEAYTKSISAKPNVDAYFERGQTYVALGDFQKAIDDYDKAIQEMPDSPAVYRARGLARRSIGDEAGYEADRDAASRIEHRQ
jgi:tetratricopeptide (TPR) repeat protein